MAEEKYKRKLTAILSADVAGYSRLMAEDESSTVKTLELEIESCGLFLSRIGAVAHSREASIPVGIKHLAGG